MKNILITGATSGLGLMLCRYYDSKKYEIISIGRDKKKLKSLKKEVSINNQKTAFALDLN